VATAATAATAAIQVTAKDMGMGTDQLVKYKEVSKVVFMAGKQ